MEKDFEKGKEVLASNGTKAGKPENAWCILEIVPDGYGKLYGMGLRDSSPSSVATAPCFKMFKIRR